jgi:hypothetical protein
MFDFAPYQREGLAGALALHLCIYCGVGACFGFGIYELLQPARVSNPGLAAYQPPPRTLPMDTRPPREVLSYGATSLTMPSQSAPIAKRVAAATEAEPETTGHSMREPEGRRPPLTAAPPTAVNRLNEGRKSERRTTKPSPEPREAKPGVSAQEKRVACLPRYDSSGAQTSVC